MRTQFIATTFCALAAFSSSASAADTIRPGLWQLQVSMPGMPKGAGSMAANIEAMKKQMPHMRPEQRKEMERMLTDLAANGTEYTADGIRTKQCVTKKEIEEFQLLPQKNADGCQRTSSVKDKEMRVSMKCTQPKMTLDAALKLQNEKAYSFESTTTIDGPGGKPVVQKSTGTGKWLSDDCGKVKPASGG